MKEAGVLAGRFMRKNDERVEAVSGEAAVRERSGVAQTIVRNSGGGKMQKQAGIRLYCGSHDDCYGALH